MKHQVRTSRKMTGAGVAVTNFSNFVIVPSTLLLPYLMPEIASSKGVPVFIVLMRSWSPFISTVLTSLLFHSQPEIRVLEKLMPLVLHPPPISTKAIGEKYVWNHANLQGQMDVLIKPEISEEF